MVFGGKLEKWFKIIQYETIDCELNNAPTITIDEHLEDGHFLSILIIVC